MSRVTTGTKLIGRSLNLFSSFGKIRSGLGANMSVKKNLTTSTSETSSRNVITERMGTLFLIGINRPEVRNCVNVETANLLIDAFEEFERDDALDVAILHGIGGNFCAGFDLKELSTFAELPLEKVADVFDMKHRPLGPTYMSFSKPTIAAVSGFAVAGGLELALLCDMRVVEDTAVMGVFCRRFGVPLIDGGTVRLPKLIGLSRAMDMILTGRGVSGKEALDFGLANRLVGCGTALGQSIMLANSLTKFPKECMLADRRSAIYSSYDAKSFQDALEYEWKYSKDIIVKEAVGGATKFASGVGRHGKFNIDSEVPCKL